MAKSKEILLLILMVFIVVFANAQDIITKTNGDEIEAKVQEVGSTEIKYKKISGSGPVYTIAKSEVFMIKYENGSKDWFGREQKTATTATPVTTSTTQVSTTTPVQTSSSTTPAQYTVKAGDVSILKKDITALLELDFSKTMVEKQHIDEYLKSRGDDFVKDFPEDIAGATNVFIYQFNRKNNGMQISTNVNNAEYKMVICITNLDYGNAGSSFVPFAGAKAGGCIIDGTINILNLKTNEMFEIHKFNGIKGNGNFSDKGRLNAVFIELANKIVKLK